MDRAQLVEFVRRRGLAVVATRGPDGAPQAALIAISSIAAYTGGSRPGGAVHAAAKAGRLGLTRSLARELTPQGITADTIAPGFIRTYFHGDNVTPATDAVIDEIPASRVLRTRRRADQLTNSRPRRRIRFRQAGRSSGYSRAGHSGGQCGSAARRGRASPRPETGEPSQ